MIHSTPHVQYETAKCTQINEHHFIDTNAAQSRCKPASVTLIHPGKINSRF